MSGAVVSTTVPGMIEYGVCWPYDVAAAVIPTTKKCNTKSDESAWSPQLLAMASPGVVPAVY